jgi:hypothetical protein
MTSSAGGWISLCFLSARTLGLFTGGGGGKGGGLGINESTGCVIAYIGFSVCMRISDGSMGRTTPSSTPRYIGFVHDVCSGGAFAASIRPPTLAEGASISRDS